MANIIKKYLKNFESITKYYYFLVNKTKNHEYVEITNEWLIDNYYLLVEHKNNIISNKMMLQKELKTINSNYYILKNIVSKKNYSVSFNYLIEELKRYQKETKKIFTYKELKNIMVTLVIIYTEALNELCHEEYIKLVDKEDVEKIINSKSNITLDSFINNNFDLKNNYHYIFEINNQLYRVENNAYIFKELNEYLKDNSVILKDIVNEEFQNKINNNVLISNIFTDLKNFFELSIEDLYEKVSKTEKKLLQDPIYKSMSPKTKTSYRVQLIKLANRKHMSEYDYLDKIFTLDEHIGFKLFKKKTSLSVFYVYFITILVLTLGISYLLSTFFIKCRILGFLILIVPVSQIIIQIFNHFLTNVTPTRIIPKLDYTKGIPDTAKTMVVIPTIISDTKKIKQMFETLESFYLENKTDNLFFTLLGDTKAGSEKEYDYDREISKYGKEYAENLNKKYKKELFYFIYRKRVWNKRENSYIGYERKRGALLQFNKILLGEYVDEAKYYNVNMLHNNKLGIKYVITLDADTQLVLDSALKLVGAMDHPLNRPVLNK